jgi:1,4-dihydroxy-2-naphthoate octaprenyltransferase
MYEMTKITTSEYIKAWVLTTRPKTLILSVFPFLIGTIIAMTKVPRVNWLLMVSAILSALFIQIGTNFINDVYDFKNKADKPTRLGPKRGIQSGILTSPQVFLGALSAFAIALLFGIPLVLKGGFIISLILLISVACGYLYTGGPKPLAYNGLGEVFVIIFFGIVSTTAAFFLQTGYVDATIVLVSLQLGAFATLPIAINNLRDIKDDALADKKTLAVRFGKSFARVEITILAFLPFLLGFCFENVFITFIPWLTLPLCFAITRQIWNTEPSVVYNIFLGQSIVLYILFSSLLTVGFLL